MSERRRTVVVATTVALIVAGVFGTGTFSVWASSPHGDFELYFGSPSAADHAFLEILPDGKTPYSWDPCKAIHIVVNDRTAIEGGTRLVAEAIAQVEKATGLAIVVDGPTDEKPSSSRPIDVPRYRTLNTPVLLAWSDPDKSPKLSGPTVGYAGSQSVISFGRRGHRPAYVTGSVTLDGPQLKRLARRPGGWEEARAIVMHELGHLIGLDHVEARGEIMQPKAQAGQLAWGPGDLAGLAVLGSGRCVNEPPTIGR